MVDAMLRVVSTIATSMALLGSSMAPKGYKRPSETPFRDDRNRLFGDYRKVCLDLNKSIFRVKEENVSKAHGS